MITADYEDIQTFIDENADICGPAVWVTKHDDGPNPQLIVTAVVDVWDARNWAAMFGCDDRAEKVTVDHGQRLSSWFTVWRGWHLMVHGSLPLQPPNEVVADVVLAAVMA